CFIFVTIALAYSVSFSMSGPAIYMPTDEPPRPSPMLPAIDDEADTVTCQSLEEYFLISCRVWLIRSFCDFFLSPTGTSDTFTKPLFGPEPRPNPASTSVFLTPGTSALLSREMRSRIDWVAESEVPCGPRTFT